jgi:hypothetical protein
LEPAEENPVAKQIAPELPATAAPDLTESDPDDASSEETEPITTLPDEQEHASL